MMTERIARLKAYLENREHRKNRRKLTDDELAVILPQIRDTSRTYMERHTLRLRLFLERETPVLLPDTHVFGLRTIEYFPDIYSEDELAEIKKTHYVHEKGKVTNLAWAVEAVLTEGLEGRRNRLLSGKREDEEFVRLGCETIDIVEAFADRYAAAMTEAGFGAEGEALSRAIRTGAHTMAEAFQVFRILHFAVWASDCYHNTVGRFDQWLLPFYRHDIDAGIETKESALEKIEDFFLSFNWDSDLYYSLAWGDNGQSLVLGGLLPDGSNGINEVTELALIAAREVRQIDPKVNLRVDKNTPIEIYELATELTKIGLGFPQYANDDVVIPCLEYWGYAPEDARNYAIAACWEFIVPEVAMDIPNINGLSMAETIRNTIIEHLDACENMDALMECVREAIRVRAVSMASVVKNLHLEPAPLLSLLMRDCADQGRDISAGAKYNNIGFHGTGLSCAADQLAAVDSMIYRTGRITKARLLDGMETDFANDAELKHLLRNDADKMGRDDTANEIGNRLLHFFADAFEGLTNERGGIVRAGTGSAMYYVWHSRDLGATADGRAAGEYLPCNFSPSLFLTKSGPLSVLLGFSPDALKRTSNGGPMTLELHDTVFREEASVHKVAELVRAYILAGGHQLQLNAVNAEKLRAAQLEPEKYQELIVRVWGWSGHFVELDKCYQDQVLSRVEYKQI
ncbi:MAG: pyruvate formate-lyase [Clostridia bacterium]|nr:pyruvate formate-lyase [Clostridia bacterium]